MFCKIPKFPEISPNFSQNCLNCSKLLQIFHKIPQISRKFPKFSVYFSKIPQILRKIPQNSQKKNLNFPKSFKISTFFSQNSSNFSKIFEIFRKISQKKNGGVPRTWSTAARRGRRRPRRSPSPAGKITVFLAHFCENSLVSSAFLRKFRPPVRP